MYYLMDQDEAPRIYDADDFETALHRILPVISGKRAERITVYAEYDSSQKQLTRAWFITPEGALDSRELQLDPARLHPLMRDDVAGHRPLRPTDSSPEWALKDLFRGVDLRKRRVRVRVVADDGRWLGVLGIASQVSLLSRGDDPRVQTLCDTLELALGRILTRQRLVDLEQQHRVNLEKAVRRSAERLQQVEREIAELESAKRMTEPRISALEEAAARATEMLMETHVELAGKTERMRRQARVIFLLRQLLDQYADGVAPDALAAAVVRAVSNAFGGERCSLLLTDPALRERSLRMAAAHGMPADVDVRSVNIEVGRGVSGWVARHQAPVVVRDEGESAHFPLAKDQGYTGPAFASLPLTCNGRLLGVLNLTNFRDGTFDDVELEMLRLVARCIALVVDHARLSERLFAGPAASLNS
jgi:hypothetical protein